MDESTTEKNALKQPAPIIYVGSVALFMNQITDIIFSSLMDGGVTYRKADVYVISVWRNDRQVAHSFYGNNAILLEKYIKQIGLVVSEDT